VHAHLYGIERDMAGNMRTHLVNCRALDPPTGGLVRHQDEPEAQPSQHIQRGGRIAYNEHLFKRSGGIAVAYEGYV
jgi:hypothetical protein